MLDLNWIRQNVKLFNEEMKKRGEVPQGDKILALDTKRREIITELQNLQQHRNNKSKDIGNIKDKTSKEFEDAKNEVLEINNKITQLKLEEETLASQLQEILDITPNILLSDVPFGLDEKGNITVAVHDTPRTFSFTPKEHTELGEQLEMLDFKQSAKISGSRYVTLHKDLAKLERALANFMIDIHTNEFGFQEVSVPYLVKSSSMYGTGQLPKFVEESFQTTSGSWLIPTAEIPVTNLVSDSIIDKNLLPLRYVAHTPCFRSEAGSASKDTHGMIRMHQFHKVELVTITSEENYLQEFDHLTKAAEEILKRLELPYRKQLLCSGDTGFYSEKTFDLEVWMPSQNKYREISSCSTCGQFQARRMKARYRDKNETETTFLYTMNGSGLAIGRTIIAILENFQNEDGSITIPESLRSYMNYLPIIKK
jgi:seryl-tRNA synthetase